MEVHVRRARREDLAPILDLYNYYVEHTATTFEISRVCVEDRVEWFEAHSRDGSYRLVVAEEIDHGIVGWASASPFRPREAYATTVETSVYCRPGLEGKGIGTQLYTNLFDSLSGQDIERIVAGIALPNPASLALHRRFGFRLVGTFTRVGRKFGRYWDVAWFERPLSLNAPSPSAGPPRSEGPQRAKDL